MILYLTKVSSSLAEVGKFIQAFFICASYPANKPRVVYEFYTTNCRTSRALQRSDHRIQAKANSDLLRHLIGVRRKARVLPLYSPWPTICPLSFMLTAVPNCQPELEGIRLFRYLIEPLSHKSAR